MLLAFFGLAGAAAVRDATIEWVVTSAWMSLPDPVLANWNAPFWPFQLELSFQAVLKSLEAELTESRKYPPKWSVRLLDKSKDAVPDTNESNNTSIESMTPSELSSRAISSRNDPMEGSSGVTHGTSPWGAGAAYGEVTLSMASKASDKSSVFADIWD